MISEKRIVEKEVYIAYDGKEFDNDVTCLRYEKQKQTLESIKCRQYSTDKITPLIQHCVWNEEEESFLALDSFESLGYFYATTDYEKDLVNCLTECIGYCSMPYESFDFDLVYWDEQPGEWKPLELKINELVFDLTKYNTLMEEFEND